MTKLNYRYDESLEFLQYCTNEELNFFVELYRDVAPLTKQLTSEGLYKKYFPTHKKYWKLIVAELQYFGGNTLLNLQRRRGVLYKDILCDVCDKYFVSYDKKADVAQIEKRLIWTLVEKNIKNMSIAELEDFKTSYNFIYADELRLLNEVKKRIFSSQSFFKNITTDLTNSLGVTLLKQGIKVALPILAKQITRKAVGLPLGVALGLKDISDPAFRVTLPCAIYISYLREKYKEKDLEFRERFHPKPGTILRTELAGDIIDHSGICIGDNEIVEIFNENGKAVVKQVSYEEFVYGSSLRTGTTIYVAIDRLSKEMICETKLSDNAIKYLGKEKEYKLLEDNCHSFVHKCIIDEKFENQTEIALFQELENSISTNLNDNREVRWAVCDINPIEHKKIKKWKIEDEVV